MTEQSFIIYQTQKKESLLLRKVNTLVLFFLILPSVFAYPLSFETILQKGEDYFSRRYLNSTYTDSAYQLLAAARPKYPDDEHGLALWSQVGIEMGDDAILNADKIAYYTIAQHAAETLKMINSDNPAGHFWWASAYGMVGLTEGTLNALFRVPAVKNELKMTLELDSNFVLAYAILGILYRELPAVVVGDFAVSRYYFETGLARDSTFTLLRLELARLEIKEGQWEAARQQLEELLATEKPRYQAAFVMNDRPEALKLLAEIKNK
jgi:Tetratricopeptide repeat